METVVFGEVSLVAADKQKAHVEYIVRGDNVELSCSGNWTVLGLNVIPGKLARLVGTIRKVHVVWNVTGIEDIDSAGMMLVIRYQNILQENGCSVEFAGLSGDYERIYRLVQEFSRETPRVKADLRFILLKPFTAIGKSVADFIRDIPAFLAFLGETSVVLAASLFRPLSIRYRAIVKNIEEAGVRAMPIVALTSFLIGVVIAYQGAVQLEKFGANIFIVDMIGISISRELAPLITAIVVAGRTGSSYTAQLGVMKITEEIDAMRTMGFDPYRFLVLPRIIALMLIMPLMIFFADIVGIASGMFISKIHLNLSYGEFLRRLQLVLEVKHVWIGIFKGPFFAFLIAAIGCYRGFQVSKSTESIGRYTTISVVNAIFLVIACDALFSVLFTELGI